MDATAQEAKLRLIKSQQKLVKAWFRALKKQPSGALNKQFHEAHRQTFEAMDCLTCARCCSEVGPLFTDRDIQRLSKHLGLKASEFEHRYLRLDEDGDWVLQSVPCPFLGEDKHCSVYDYRPKACREYPHTDHAQMKEVLDLTRKNAACCPAVADMVLRMMHGRP